MNQPAATRRLLLAAMLGSSLLAGCAIPSQTAVTWPTIVFVPGNTDGAQGWQVQLWRFESAGWPRDRLHVVHMPHPQARDDDTQPQEGRSSTADAMRDLSTEVDKALAANGAKQVVLVGASRGGNTVRNYVINGSAAGKVSHAILAGSPSHGVVSFPDRRLGSEFNGAGHFLRRLNEPRWPNGDEVPPGVKWMTIRSDNNDLYAQPDGAFIGMKGVPTNVTFDTTALKGAYNFVIPGADHRDTAFGAKAFEAMVAFITGKAPNSTAVVPERRVVLNGIVSGPFGLEGNTPTNLPLSGAVVEVYATDQQTGERIGGPAHRKTVGADGTWGPFEAQSNTPYEFVAMAPGLPTIHIYRSPFPRSSAHMHLRLERFLEADKGAAAVVSLVRHRAYMGLPRDQVSLDGSNPPAGIEPGIPAAGSVRLKIAEPGRAVVGEVNGERVVGRAWAAAENAMTSLELTY